MAWLTPLAMLAGLAALCAAVTGALILLSERWHARLSHDHDLDGVQKLHAAPVPRVGGLAVAGAVAAAVALLAWRAPQLLPDGAARALLLLCAASIPAFAAGFVEDLTKRVSVRLRLLATLGSALLASVLLGATVARLDIWGVDALLALAPVALAVTAFVVAGGANAINIIDGVNGLSGGVSLVMAAALGALALHVGDPLVALLAAPAAGAAFGFLLLNYPRGSLFLGDGGAYFLGFWVAEVAVLLLVRNPEVNAWQVLGICGYPVIEVLFSIYRRRFIKCVHPARPDALHLHTLMYRRLAPRLVGQAAPWRRNALVALLTVPCVALAAAASVRYGAQLVPAALLVVGQLGLYLAVYARLVRGRWQVRPAPAPAPAAVRPR